MKFNYYKDTDSLYIDFSSATSSSSKEISDGVVADFDSSGNLVGLDIDNASKIANLGKFRAEGFKPEFINL